MKRSIHDTKIESPKPLSASSMSTSSTIQRTQPKEFQDSRLSTEGYWKGKTSNLQNAFAAGHGTNEQPQQPMNTLPDQGNQAPPKPRPTALNLSMARPNIPAIHIQIPSPEAKTTMSNAMSNNKAITNPPLSCNAISHILQRTKPTCPKAQSWITAQRISEEMKMRVAQKIGRLGVNERVIVERKIAARLAEKARQMQVQQGGMGLMQRQEQNQGKKVEEDWVEGNLTPQQRVKRANVRLQRAVGLE
ncbi:hypothetical protein SI65_02232 [Aspergillus cristatus]|uniref:Uncharacterized protein n=1 Tax=Aspergillus cristatus TaxID=573508 RepID=A0A1E3BKC7_ASPCR|nr:hypothetical protein SI65_02232 [Aspergillus cristatus]